MQYCIDYDNPETFPKSLRDWGSDFENMILSKINLDKVSEWWQIQNQLQDLHIEEMEIISDFVKENAELEVAVCHCARILDVNDYWNNGIITAGGKNSLGEERIRNLLDNIGVPQDKINVILDKVNDYWVRDRTSRTKSVHFFVIKTNFICFRKKGGANGLPFFRQRGVVTPVCCLGKVLKPYTLRGKTFN